ncbi:MAG: methionine--tRNA ligase [Bdellovibrionales bacterium]|nr:methionine--tRNA ligase [Bdellovibrionales bacterium]
MKRFYVTTPIYYPNAKPHIGTSYSTIMADVLKRYHKLFGREAYFVTGTDEHGQKIQQAAEERGLSPLAHCDEMAENYKTAWKDLEIDYDHFFRTTAEWHIQSVQTCLQKLWDKGEIYADTYEGWYSVSEEIFYTDKEVVDGKSPSGRDVTRIKEKNYFFKMSKYQQQLIDYINNNPGFIEPDVRKNEVLGFLKQPLGDLCISRPKSRLQWGVELPFDTDYVCYVWFDALLNYATAVGLGRTGMESDFEKWWNSDEAGAHHLLGKDILTTHAVYWPTMLMALGYKLPKKIFAHGWILNKDNAKMSKSQGQLATAKDFTDLVGVEPLRYFLAHDIHFGNDAPISIELVVNRVNNDLANNIGNLLSRSSNLIVKYFDGKCPGSSDTDEPTKKLIALAEKAADIVKEKIETFDPSRALEAIILLLNEANRFLEEKAPWTTAKTDVAQAGKDLYSAIEVLRISAILLSPVLPEKMSELLTRVGCQDRSFTAAQKWGLTKEGTPIEKGSPLFPRIEMPKDV